MTQGRRVEMNTDPGPLLQPGDYCKNPDDGFWYFMPPVEDAGIGSLAGHIVIEHDDGTITVSPSILLTYYAESKGEKLQWHGYLERGIWREV